jgi:hypothetical protein
VMPFTPPAPTRVQPPSIMGSPSSPTWRSVEPIVGVTPEPPRPVAAPNVGRREPDSAATLPSADSGRTARPDESRRGRRRGRSLGVTWISREIRLAAPFVGLVIIGSIVWRMRTGGDKRETLTADTPTPTASAPPSASPPPPDPRRVVRVAIAPGSAQVTVDGVLIDASQGAIQISGSLGSLHRVRVSDQGRETSANVVITEAGAMPASLRLEPAPGPSAKIVRKAGTVTPSSDATLAATGAPPAPSASAGHPSRFSTLDKNFE